MGRSATMKAKRKPEEVAESSDNLKKVKKSASEKPKEVPPKDDHASLSGDASKKGKRKRRKDDTEEDGAILPPGDLTSSIGAPEEAPSSVSLPTQPQAPSLPPPSNVKPSKHTPGGSSYGRGFFRTVDGREATKKGKFSKAEKEKLYAKLKEYLESINKTEADLPIMCAREGNSEYRGMWFLVATALPDRPISSIYDHIVRKWSPKKEGPWDEEEVKMLKALVKERGNKWAQIGRHLNRYPGSCRDKYRLVKDDFKKGHWTPEEDAKLLRLVKESVGGEGDELPKEKILWTPISEQMGTRSHSSCRNRYFSTVYQKGMMEELKKKDADASRDVLKEQDIAIIEAIIEQSPEDESDIDYNDLVPGATSELCRNRFRTLLRRARSPELKTLEMKLQYLKSKPELMGLPYYRPGMRLDKDPSKRGTDGESKFKRKKDGSLRVSRAISAYMFFVQERFKGKRSSGEEGQQDLLKKLGDDWKNMKPEQKKKYEVMAKQDKIRFEKEKDELDKILKQAMEDSMAIPSELLPPAPGPVILPKPATKETKKANK